MMKAVLCMLILVVSTISTVAAKDVERQKPQIKSLPNRSAPLPPDLGGTAFAFPRSSVVADTFVLHAANFDAGGGPNAMGYTTVDITEQIAAFFHVADSLELNGGENGGLAPLSGYQSMWCGQAPTSAVPFCGYATLPGYGDNWDQIFITDPLAGDSASISYKVFFDSEPGYDGTVLEFTFDDGDTWNRVAVTDSFSSRTSVYDGYALPPYMTETFAFGEPGATDVRIRFRFASDGAWSDEDGMWPTDGAIIFDDITVQTWNGGVPSVSNTEDFEAAPPSPSTNIVGIWTGRGAVSYGDFAALYPGVSVAQGDPCLFVGTFLWGFFDDPINTPYLCHTPNPLPGQGAMPFGIEGEGSSFGGGYYNSTGGLYMSNEIWSPVFANTGEGDEYLLKFKVYRDLPLDNLQFFVWHVRTWKDGCPGWWKDSNFVFYGGGRDWLSNTTSIGAHIDSDADHIQIALGAVDMCGVWCNVFGSGTCHSHAPLFDDVALLRVASFGPQIVVRHIDLFQDNFAEDGTLTGTARADAANDILPYYGSPGILPGDSVTMTITDLGADVGGGPAAYCYVRVQNSTDPKSGAGLGSMDTRSGLAGPRWPHKGSWTDANSKVWEILQMDSVTTSGGSVIGGRYCVDLNDGLFVPGDTIHYFFGADLDATAGNGNESYWHRALDGQGPNRATSNREEAAASPCEFTILPAGGYNRGGDILYVDDTDDRGGPAQLLFDSAFELLAMRNEVDRYDVLGPSSAVGNSLASRVKSNLNQINSVYKSIIWNTGNLSSGTLGDGTGSPEKSDDFALLEQFLRLSDKGPGLYLSGDNIAEEWNWLSGSSAIVMRTTQIPFDLADGDHHNYGEPVSPTLTAAPGSYFQHLGVPDVLIAYGGCPLINNFDVITPTGTSIEEFPYPNAGPGVGRSAIISNQFLNSANETATIVLSGFSYHYIRDASIQSPPARVEHLEDILNMMGHINYFPTTGAPDDGAQFVNALGANYPNPFNPVTTIKYSIKERAHVSLKVYNAAGQLVKTLIDGVQSPDEIKPLRWDGRNDTGHSVSSGVYFYKLETKGFAKTKKMVLLK